MISHSSSGIPFKLSSSPLVITRSSGSRTLFTYRKHERTGLQHYAVNRVHDHRELVITSGQLGLSTGNYELTSVVNFFYML